MRPYQNADRFKAAVKQLARLDAATAQALEAVRPSTRLVIGDGGGLNVDLGGGQTLYPDSAEAAAMRQVEDYVAAPFRIFLPPGDVLEDCIALNALTRSLRAGMAEFPRAPAQAPFGGFLVVFGVGLGYHIKALVERLPFKTLIVVEPHDELIAHSFHAMDWQGLFRTLARTGRQIHFVRGAGLYEQVIRIMRGADYPLVDGSYSYFHYATPELTAVGQRLLAPGAAGESSLGLGMAAGWVEDQLLMLRNNAANFARPGFHLQTARLRSARSIPAIVVGAGPSLDAAIEAIRAVQDRAVIITSSSALKVLLSNGIRPHIHCELENGAGLGVVAEELDARFGLSDMVLYASPTVDPRISPRFRQTVYFHRSDLSSTHFYANGAEITGLAEPTSGNTAVYCALSLGFREVYLFGLDFGARDPDYHHSRHSVYFTYQDESELATYTPYDFDKILPGNFGGQVRSGWVLDWGRESVVNAIRAVGQARVWNCSDGVLIAGAAPLDPDSVEIAAAAEPPHVVVDQALSELTLCRDDMSEPERFAAMVAELHGFLDGVVAEIEGLRLEGNSPQAAMVGLCERIMGRLQSLESGQRAIHATVLGHLEKALAAAYHYASTVEPSHADEAFAVLRRVLGDGVQALHPMIQASLGAPPS
ncbi:hypothetical protein A6A04_04110 [Paramagnetospirillum marisnigri]|uniref:DUF115 domain-containing protein n=1 Tax=Paramagnetospirillum marisnigri TaxID=1285242 RepID=A0A178MKV7_9PROT|nr:6-hydroxymethylpterin diphosphokinase MptE-like protein [Paramagnetospirillum marisnigri]OAN49306.1 hypothetical protein A6A04_04110 [Paramagnetospirillum marisnigri]